MDSLTKLHHPRQPLSLSLNHHRSSSFPKPISLLSFRTPPPPPPPPPPSPSKRSSSSRFISSSVRASFSSSNSFSDPFRQDPKPSLFETLNPLFFSILKATCVSIAAGALFFMRFHLRSAIAAPIAPSVESAQESTNGEVSYEEKEKGFEEQLRSDPDDVDALRSLMEVRIKSGKLAEAIEILDRLIELEPNDYEWPLLKANIHSYMGNTELARNEFEDILAKDPLRVEAYHGLVMASEPSDNNSLKGILKRVEEAMGKCKKEGNKSETRDFKLLVAQIKVMEGSYFDALKVYQELVREEPRDFRPYLCQGIIYALLRKNDEAEKQFVKFRKLVPKNHPYKEYFDDNMFATKFFGQKVERERAGSKS